MKYRFPHKPRPSGKLYFALGIPDFHDGYLVDTPTHSHGCWDIGMQAIDHYGKRLTHVVIYGDFGNWESLSRWAALRAEQIYVKEDIAIVRHFLDEIDRLCAKSVKKICKSRGVRCCFPRSASITGLKKALQEHYSDQQVA